MSDTGQETYVRGPLTVSRPSAMCEVVLLQGGHVMATQKEHARPPEQRRHAARRSDDVGPGGRAELCHDLREPAATIVMLADAATTESGDPLAVRRRLRQIQA